MSNGLQIFAQGVLQHNIILLQGLGLYALTRYTRDFATACKASLAMVLTMVSASGLLWGVESLVPDMFGLDMPLYLLIAIGVAFFWQKVLGGGKWLPEFDGSLVSGLVNSAVVGLLLVLSRTTVVEGATFMYGFSLAVGYGLVLLVMAGIRQRLELAPIPKALQGTPILLITAGLLALALMGFRI